jgi:hypothetical protein
MRASDIIFSLQKGVRTATQKDTKDASLSLSLSLSLERERERELL